MALLYGVPQTIEIINNTGGGIQSKIWECANGGQIEVPDVLNNENCTAHPNIELSVPYFQSIRDLNLPPISALPFTTNVSGNNAPTSVIYNLYTPNRQGDASTFLNFLLGPSIRVAPIFLPPPQDFAASWQGSVIFQHRLITITVNSWVICVQCSTSSW